MVYECTNCGAENESASLPCVGCKLVSPPRKPIFKVEPTHISTLPDGRRFQHYDIKLRKTKHLS